MSRRSLGLQLNIVFSIVVVFTSLFFGATMKRTFQNITLEQDRYQQRAYFEDIVDMYNRGKPVPSSEYNGYIIITKDMTSQSVVSFEGLDILTEGEALEKARNMFGAVYNHAKREINEPSIYYIGEYLNAEDVVVLTFTDGRHQQIANAQISNRALWGFVAIMILGNVFILLWSNLLVERIKILKTDVSKLTKQQYKHKIKVDGNDEVTDLAVAIENMRLEILKNEQDKQEMLQNVSHDFKTPIAVIRSYAEAVKDGISDVLDLDVVIKQTEILNNKVKQLIELNKLEYLKKQETFVDVQIKNIINQIVNLHKFENIKFELDLDDGTYYGTSENLYTAFSNIIDNALRYAKTTIKITFKNKKLTFFNDGEPIDQTYLDNAFKAYQKGAKGESGLGLHIVYKTLEHFNLKIDIENQKNGVAFMIEPL